MRGKWVGILFIVFPLFCHASYVFNNSCKDAYRLVWQYRLPEAEKALQAAENADPGNAVPAYIRETGLFLKSFATEEAADEAAFKKQYDRTMSLLDKSGSNSPWYYFIRSEALFHDALLRLKRAEYMTASYDMSKAYNALNSCYARYPDFLPAQKNLWAMKAAIGSIPDNYRWMIKLLGFSGNLKQSMAAYEGLIRKMQSHPDYNIFLGETQILHSYLEMYLLNQPEAAWKDMTQATDDYKDSPIASFARSSMALHLKKNEEAITVLSTQTAQAPALHHLDYLLGIAKLQRGDRNAGFYLARYIKNYQGKNYIKDAYLKLGWAFLLNGDAATYADCMKLVKMEGAENVEEDVNALKESQQPAPPVSLLRARLLYDGGYFENAQKTLATVDASTLSKNRQAEYYYRLGRIHEGLDNWSQALTQYDKVIRSYSANEGYYVPAACVYSGMIWEQQGNTPKAKAYYQKCLTYKNYPYKNSFDQKAEAGLRRLEGN